MSAEKHRGPVEFNRAFAIGIALNTGFVAIEGFYGWKVDSLALLADAGHNLSDVAGLVFAWLGALAGQLRTSPRHTYGWKRASILAAFANALLLLHSPARFGVAPRRFFSALALSLGLCDPSRIAVGLRFAPSRKTPRRMLNTRNRAGLFSGDGFTGLGGD